MSESSPSDAGKQPRWKLAGMVVHDQHGTPVGEVARAWREIDTGRVAWITIHPDRSPDSERFAPLKGARYVRKALVLPYDAEFLEQAPEFQPGLDVSRAHHAQLQRYFGPADQT